MNESLDEKLNQILTDEPDDSIESKVHWLVIATKTNALAICHIKKNQHWIRRGLGLLAMLVVGMKMI